MVMTRRGMRAVGERSHREPPQERGYRRLGAAVILSAVRDLEKPTRAGGESVRAGESARAFLTVSNSHLKFWCRVADVDMNAILRTYWQGGNVARIVSGVQPDEFDDVVKEPLPGRFVRVHGEQARGTRRERADQHGDARRRAQPGWSDESSRAVETMDRLWNAPT